MLLTVLGSGSKGNGYALTDREGVTLLIEAGVSIHEVKKALDFDLASVAGCLVSHSHGDHAKYIHQYLGSGLDIYSGEETIKSLGLESHYRAMPISPKSKYTIGSFTVMAFSVKHDVPCLGFMILHEEMGVTVFITDSIYSPYKFANVNNWIIEANYSEEILENKLQRGEAKQFLRDRILNSHFSLENCLDMLDANDLSQTNKIVLTHLSDSNSDARMFKEAVETKTGKDTYIADTDLKISFNKTPF